MLGFSCQNAAIATQMTPLHRLNSFMPFVILTYLMMSWVQFHATPWNNFLPGRAGVNFLKELESGISAVEKNASAAFHDPTHYEIGDFIPP